MLPLRRLFVALAALAVLVTACSSSADEAATTTTAAPAAAPTTESGEQPTATSGEVDEGEVDDSDTDDSPADGPLSDPTAVIASVGDIEITAADLSEETSLASEFGEANPEAAAALADADNPEIRADLLAGLVVDNVLAASIAADGGAISEEQRTSIVDSLPPGLQPTEWLDRFVERQARFLAFGTAVAVSQGLPATPEDWFAENPDVLGDIACSRHILLETEDAALDARARIVDGGEDFAVVAQEESTGPSGPNGGDLGCDDPSGFVEEFADAVRTLPINEVSAPVETQFGFHIIEVTARGADSLPAAELTSRITELYNVEVSGLAETALDELLASTDISVDPAIGTWEPDFRTVIPPEG